MSGKQPATESTLLPRNGGNVRKTSGENEKPPATRSGKLPVAEPASFSRFFTVLVMHLCKRVLLINTRSLAMFYICSITVISLLTDLFPFPKTYFANKHNMWNQYFVKLGLAWTLICVAPLIYFTSYVLSLGKTKIVYRHMGRLGLLFACWFIVTSVIQFLETRFSYCNVKIGSFSTKQACAENNGVWTKWLDISGHCFLLVLCILTIGEEAVVFRDWSKLSELLRKEDKNYFHRLGPSEIENLKELYNKYTPAVRLAMLGMSLIQIVWNIMLLTTTIYFHFMPDKFLGVALGVMCWSINYYVICKMDNSLPSPYDVMKNPFRHTKEA